MIEAIKILRADITEILYNTDDLQVLRAIYAKLKALKGSSEKTEKPLFLEAVRPIKSNTSIEEIMRAQDYKPVTYSTYRKKVDNLHWNQSLDELLEALD
ncbi:MAG: hypothetical protein R3B47_06375 [Bacteroidia bacterium]